VVTEGPHALLVDLSPVVADGPVDVMFVSNGTWRVVAGVEAGAWLDTGAADDTGGTPPGDMAEAPRGACGCTGTGRGLPGWWLAPLVLFRRRNLADASSPGRPPRHRRARGL